jgi:hypothetical protein
MKQKTIIAWLLAVAMVAGGIYVSYSFYHFWHILILNISIFCALTEVITVYFFG